MKRKSIPKFRIPKTEQRGHTCFSCGNTFTERTGYILTIYKEFNPYIFEDDHTTEEEARKREMRVYVCPDCALKLKQDIYNLKSKEASNES